MTERAVGRRWTRWVRRLILGLAVLLLLVVGFAAFLVGTTSGGRLALALAEGVLPDGLEVEVGGFSGRLIDTFELRDVDLRLPTVEIAAGRVAVDWHATGLLRKRVHVRVATVEGLDVRLLEGTADSTTTVDEAAPDSLHGPPVPELPVHISFDSVDVADITFRMNNSVWVSGARAVAAGELDDYRLSFSGHVEVPDFVTAEATLSGTGSTTDFQLESLVAEMLGGRVSASGALAWWPDVTWDGDLEAEGLEPSRILPDPDEWPGRISLTGSSTGRVSNEGQVELHAVVDTIFGEVRGELLDGRFEAHLRDEDLELPAAQVTWGPARVSASGTAGGTLDLTFEATVPDLGLLLPGSSGRLVARGRATGPRDVPRIQATFEADSVALESVEAESVDGEVDLDLAGPLGATVFARTLSIAGREVDSARVVLSGSRDGHRLEAAVRGPDGELDLEAAGRLDAENGWAGTVEALRFAADTVGSWVLAGPVGISVSPDVVRLGEACLVSAPARVCVEGETGNARTRVIATVDSFRVERLAPLMPEGISAEASVQAALAFEIEPGGELAGEVEVRTSAGLLILPVRGESRELFFEPIDLVVSSGQDGMRGEIDLHVMDATGVRILDVGGRVESPAAIRSAEDFARLRGQPVSAHLEIEADDLLLLTDELLPVWDVSGSFRAVADVETDAEGRLTGSLDAATESLVARNTVRGQGWTLTADPARISVNIGPDGLQGDLRLAVDVAGMGALLTASGEIALPNLTTIDVNPEEQPLEASLHVAVSDISIAEAFLLEISDAAGSFELDTRLAGTLADATVEGEARLRDGYALIPALGLELTGMRFTATGQQDGVIEVDGEVHSGSGNLTLTGRAVRHPSAEAPNVFQLRGERFVVMDIPEINLEAEPHLDLTFDGSTRRLTGEVVIPRGRLGFPEIPEAAVTPSDDVVIVGDTLVERAPRVLFGTDITVSIGRDVFFNGFGFSANLLGDINIVQDPGSDPRGRGEIQFINGTFRSFGQELRIEPGRLLFNGPIDDPGVDARAFVRASDGTEAGFRIGGTVQNLDVTTYSRPPRSDSDIMAYILFGRPMDQTSGTEGNQASNAAAVLGANMLAMSLAPSLGLDEARIDMGSSQNKAQFVVGRYVSPRLFLGYGVGIYEPISTLRIRYLLSARWSIEAITGDQQSTDLLWRIERGGPKTEASEGDTDAVDAAAASE